MTCKCSVASLPTSWGNVPELWTPKHQAVPPMKFHKLGTGAFWAKCSAPGQFPGVEEWGLPAPSNHLIWNNQWGASSILGCSWLRLAQTELFCLAWVSTALGKLSALLQSCLPKIRPQAAPFTLPESRCCWLLKWSHLNMAPTSSASGTGGSLLSAVAVFWDRQKSGNALTIFLESVARLSWGRKWE